MRQRSFHCTHNAITYTLTLLLSLSLAFRSQPVLDDSSGKSGAKFYQSYDKLFIIKTLTSEEVERMHSFLKHYHPVSSIIEENIYVRYEVLILKNYA